VILVAPFDVPVDVPVDPDNPDARRWLLDELSKPIYQSAKPTIFDQIITAIEDWLNSLVNGLGSVRVPVVGNLLPLAALVIVVGLLVVAFLVFGLPRVRRRSSAGGELFADHDDRDAATMRRDAQRAAASGDYTAAIAELFRALARGLDERTLVSAFPGSTASDVAARAGRVFPDTAARLREAASAFDGVRYLGAVGTVAQWDQLVALERELRTARAPHERDDEHADEFIGAPR
jgi:hypothetical protein